MVIALGIDTLPDDDKTFIDGAGMSPSGNPNMTHPCCSMVATDTQLANIQSKFGSVAGSRLYIDDERIHGAARRALAAAENGEGLKIVKDK